MSVRSALAVVIAACLGFGLSGCGKPTDKEPVAVKSAADTDAHGEWWCNEHGVPEEVCALCSTKLVADFKAKGDWCSKHERPDSQCFTCHPENQAEFAALYEAKYGKQPPKPTDNGA
jgi:cobalt-zinc-cadmium efflux system membrane fusion protein